MGYNDMFLLQHRLTGNSTDEINTLKGKYKLSLLKWSPYTTGSQTNKV